MLQPEDLITGIAANSRLTSAEVADLLQVLSALVQFGIADERKVVLPGIGTLTADDEGKISFEPDQAIIDQLSDPSKKIQIPSKTGLTNNDLWTGGRFICKDHVNVCS